MCGILCVINRPGALNRAKFERALRSMTHRGPDNRGIESFALNGAWEIWLGHNRLAILDPSADANQPFTIKGSRSGSIVYNGEIYNYLELKDGLSHRWRSRSDTEVLFAGLLERGPQFLSETNGFFAFCAVDNVRQELLVGRDRLGKKPLYVYQSSELLAFSSELKAFVSLGLPLNESLLGSAFYHWMGYIPSTESIYRECSKFPAASYATISLRGPELPQLEPQMFWDPLGGYAQDSELRYDSAVEELLALIDDATRLRLRSDVPVGLFLSGGIDSTLVATSAARLSGPAVRGFTVQPDDPRLDESNVAKETGRRLGIEMTILKLHQADYDRQIDLIPTSYDEPFSDASEIPTLAISEAASRHTKVVLTGDGGDEAFLGYPWLAYPDKLLRYRRPFERIPGGRPTARRLLDLPGMRFPLAGLSWLSGYNPKTVDYKIEILRTLFSPLSEPELYGHLYDYFRCTCPKMLLPAEERALLGDASLLEWNQRWYPSISWEAAAARGPLELLAALDLVCFLRDDVLVKVDRATMAYGLEARSPLLDHRIIEFGTGLPLSFKARDGTFKRILRDALATRMPGRVSTLKKTGFGVPLPPDLPDAPISGARWNRFVERLWRKSWSPLAARS